MAQNTILIVDDEKNIRLTVSQAIASPQRQVDTALNGEEALAKLQENRFDLILLDLKMPGMDGMEVLRWIGANRPDVRVVIITAHATVESAVEAMKYGAVDYIQKPFAPSEIRALVSKVLDRATLDARRAQDYAGSIELAKKYVNDKQFEVATEHVRRAMSLDPSRPEAFDLFGALLEIQGHLGEAQKNYRAALALDPTYRQARENLSRCTRTPSEDKALSAGGGRKE